MIQISTLPTRVPLAGGEKLSLLCIFMATEKASLKMTFQLQKHFGMVLRVSQDTSPQIQMLTKLSKIMMEPSYVSLLASIINLTISTSLRSEIRIS